MHILTLKAQKQPFPIDSFKKLTRKQKKKLRGFNEVGNFTMRNGRRNYFTVPTATKFTKGSSSGAQLPDLGDVHFRISPITKPKIRRIARITWQI